MAAVQLESWVDSTGTGGFTVGVTETVVPGTEAMLVALVLHPWEHDVTVATTVKVFVEAMTGVVKTVETSVVRTVVRVPETSNVQSVCEKHPP